jgi:hypothetical protein
MRFTYRLFGALSILTFLLLTASVALETLSGYKNFRLSGTELTISMTVPDRILLGALVVFLIFCGHFSLLVRQRRKRDRNGPHHPN